MVVTTGVLVRRGKAGTAMLPEFGGDSYFAADNHMTGRANGVAVPTVTLDFFGLNETVFELRCNMSQQNESQKR